MRARTHMHTAYQSIFGSTLLCLAIDKRKGWPWSPPHLHAHAHVCGKPPCSRPTCSTRTHTLTLVLAAPPAPAARHHTRMSRHRQAHTHVHASERELGIVCGRIHVSVRSSRSREGWERCARTRAAMHMSATQHNESREAQSAAAPPQHHHLTDCPTALAQKHQQQPAACRPPQAALRLPFLFSAKQEKHHIRQGLWLRVPF